MARWRAKHRTQYNEYMRKFWATHPESKQTAREWRKRNQKQINERHRIWTSIHPEKIRMQNHEQYMKNREARLASSRKYNQKIAGRKESTFYADVRKEFPEIVELDRVTPDCYEPVAKQFIEIKTAKTRKVYRWRTPSAFFPGLYFQVDNRPHGRSIDQQIRDYPKPLLVIVFDTETGLELARRQFFF